MSMLILFWVIAFGLAWALTVPSALAQLGVIDVSPIPAGLGNLIGLTPAIAAFVAAAFSGQTRVLVARTFRFRAPLSSYFLAIGLPVAWLIGTMALRDFLSADAVDVAWSMQVAAFATVWLAFAFGEEIGWRAYALPIMTERSGFWAAATMLGVIWAVWHYPKLLSGPYVESLAQAAPWLVKFSLQVILANYVLCWLFVRSRLSVPVAAAFHATFNTIATAYPLAGVDLFVTACVALCVVVIFIFDRNVGIAGDD